MPDIVIKESTSKMLRDSLLVHLQMAFDGLEITLEQDPIALGRFEIKVKKKEGLMETK